MRLETFYQDVNRSWLSKYRVPADDDSVSTFDLLEETVRKVSIQAIREERTRDTKLGHFIESIYTGRSNDLTFIKDLLDTECGGWTSIADCFRTMGLLNMYGLRTPLSVEVSFDIYNNNHYNLCISEPEIGILEEEYHDKGPTHKEYCTYLRKFFEAADLGNSQRFLELEAAISKTFWPSKDEDSTEMVYNPYNLALLKARYPAIDFVALFEGYGVERGAIGTIVVKTPQFLELMNGWATSKTLVEWAFTVKAMAMLSLSSLLPEPFKTIEFEFNRTLTGQSRPFPIDREVFLVCDEICPDLLGQLYVQTDSSNFTRIRTEATELCKTIVGAAKGRIDKLRWISHGSKEIAKDKLDNMSLKIAYPDNWRNELAGVAVDRECFLMNLLMARKQKTLMENRGLGGVSVRQRQQWSNPCYTVNAFYYTETNELCIPLGFLQSPFFSLKASYIKNLAGLGNIVGHEISHGFDEEGHKYDHKGNFYPWWTSMDVEMYKNRTRQLVDAYDKESYFGIKIDGELTLGENLADFGAIAIGLDVIKKRGNKTEELREYFIEYAKTWASKERLAKRERDVKIDVHPPAQLRVNVVLKHFDAFYEVFGFGTSEPGFVPVEERIDVWGR